MSVKLSALRDYLQGLQADRTQRWSDPLVSLGTVRRYLKLLTEAGLAAANQAVKLSGPLSGSALYKR